VFRAAILRLVSLYKKYKLRLERKKLKLRAIRRGRRDLASVKNDTKSLTKTDVILISTLRNERARLPFFLEYYRQLGVNHFLMIENGSDDGSREYLEEQSDVSLWTTAASYKRAAYGVHWMNYLLRKYAVGNWILCVDVDEFFVYPHHDTRPLSALTDWLDVCSIRSFGTLLLDMYPKGKIEDAKHSEGEDPISITPYFDSGNYSYSMNAKYKNLWIQGGPRQRVFFADKPSFGPALNKTPLVKWGRANMFVSSTHVILPRSLNVVYATDGGQMISGCLLHAKFINSFIELAQDKELRKQHYADGREYKFYERLPEVETTFFTPESTKYKGWRQLESLGLMSTGGWA
jgi:hypothetical protein